MKNIELNKKCGLRLKECRNEKKWTQDFLAEASYCCSQTVSNIETGKRELSRELAHCFAKALDVSEQYLLCESDFKTNHDEYLFRESLQDLRDNAVIFLLKTLGYKISFYGILDGKDINIPENEFQLKNAGYGNRLYITNCITKKERVLNNVKVIIDNKEITLVDFYDLIDNIKDYTDFLVQKISSEPKTPFEIHSQISYSENMKSKELSIDNISQKLKEEFGDNCTIELSDNLDLN